MSQDFNPYSNSGQSFPPRRDPFNPPPRPSGGLLWLWVVGGVVLLGGGLCAGCCGGAFYLGKSTIEADLRYELRDREVIREHIGEIEQITFNLFGTGAIEDDSEVYDIKGSKGSGEIIAFFDDEHNFVSGTLRLPSGEMLEID